MQAITPFTAFNKKFSASSGFKMNPLVLLVFFSFFFQSFYPANGDKVEAGWPALHAAIKKDTENAFPQSLVQAPIPQKTFILLLEVDLPSEDDENRRNTVSEFCKPFPANLSSDEGGYNSYLNHRFLHLNSQVNNRPAIAFFILYHSWKSDLS